MSDHTSAALALISRHLAAPKQFRITTHFADGKTRMHETATIAQAENWAIGERRKIGRDLIDRETGKTVKVVRVTIGKISQ